MPTEQQPKDTLTAGLTALFSSSFPKRCVSCGQIFEDLPEFIAKTKPSGWTKSGLKQAEEEDGNVVVELFRNCTCGSTLLEFCGDRRQQTEAGQEQRERFNELLRQLEARGMERETARTELRKLMRGEKSAPLAAFLKGEIKF